MALANTLLATWDVNGVIRNYEYANGRFVIAGSLGGFAMSTPSAQLDLGARATPLMAWDHEDDQLVVIYSQGSIFLNVAKLNAIGELSASTYQVPDPATDAAYFIGARFDDDRYLLRRINVQGSRTIISNAAGTPAASTSGPTTPGGLPGFYSPIIKSIYPSPDLRKIMYGRGSGNPRLILFGRANTAANFTLVGNYQNFSTLVPDEVVWMSDSVNAVMIDRAALRMQSWTLKETNWTWNYVHELALLPGNIRKTAMSPDGRMFAVSFQDNSGYTTRIYRKSGEYFVVLQDIPGMGALLNFTSDGALLIDAQSRVCAKLVGEEFQIDNTIVQNLATGILEQAVSKAPTTKKGQAYIYSSFLASLAEGSIDLSKLKITLLTDGATFDPVHETLDEVTGFGFYNATTGRWPTGGYLLSNTQVVTNNSSVSFKCNDVTHIVIDNALQFKSAVIYNSETNVPVAFLDFTTNRIIARNRQLVIDFTGDEFLRLTS